MFCFSRKLPSKINVEHLGPIIIIIIIVTIIRKVKSCKYLKMLRMFGKSKFWLPDQRSRIHRTQEFFLKKVLIKKNKILNNGIYILSVETQYLCPTHNHSSNSKTLGQLYSEVSFNFKKLIDFKGVLLVLRS